jgi:DNA primase small subunit
MEEDGVANIEAQQPAEEDVDMADAAPPGSFHVVSQSKEEKTTDEDIKEEKKEDVKLEDLFADGDSDDEFPSSRPAEVAQSSSPGELTPSSRQDRIPMIHAVIH